MIRVPKRAAVGLALLFLLRVDGTGHAEDWVEKRSPMIEVLRQLKRDHPVDHLYAALEPSRIDHTLWRWAMTDDLPEARARATQLLGQTPYTPERFRRLVREMDEHLIRRDQRAYDFMVAVADMRAHSDQAAEDLRRHVRWGLAPELHAHYFRARHEFQLYGESMDLRIVIQTLRSPSREARALAFREAVRLADGSDFGLQADLVSAMDLHLALAPGAEAVRALEMVARAADRHRPLIPALVRLRIAHPSPAVKRAAARTLFVLRGGRRVSDVNEIMPLQDWAAMFKRNLKALKAGAGDRLDEWCERALYK